MVQPVQLQGNRSKIAATTIAAALAAAIPFISSHEGEKLTSYQDVAGVWTVCSGIAGVKSGIHMTGAQCDKLTGDTISRFMSHVASLITVPVTAQTLAAHTSLAYNIGIEAYKRSKTLQLTNAGKIAQGCSAMINWHYVDDKDCEVRQNNCYGIVQRRHDEIKLCLSGIK